MRDWRLYDSIQRNTLANQTEKKVIGTKNTIVAKLAQLLFAYC